MVMPVCVENATVAAPELNVAVKWTSSAREKVAPWGTVNWVPIPS